MTLKNVFWQKIKLCKSCSALFKSFHLFVERFIVSVTINEREFSDSHLLTSNGIDGVEGAKDGRACGAVDEEGQAALRLVLQHALLELLRDHAAPVEQKFVFILSLGVFCVC